jgi:hypothetical protein
MGIASTGYQAEITSDLPPERAQFKELLLTDHFKELKAVTAGGPPVGNTSYEQLTCIGYQPQLKQINAVVEQKLANGYSGGLCTNGSTEYVAFYASTDGGSTWSSLGLTSFTVWDVGGPKPLEFDVTLSVDLPAYCCQETSIVLIRGILSWEVPPTGPTAPIVWGNGLDANVQVAPLTLGKFSDIWECLQIPFSIEQLGEVVNLDQVIEFGSGTALSPGELHELYKNSNVPQHRYLLPQAAALLGNPVALSAAAATPDFELIPSLKGGVNLGSLIGALKDPQGNETYEQLGCIGLNPTTTNLVATIDIKLPSGYSGNLCTNGSQEYVAFWADWGSGWEYAGTTSVNVHDIGTIPAGGLQYAAVMPFPEALAKRQPCSDGPLVVPIRAVLSWATPPSNVNPYAVPVWGGHLQGDVLIPPGQPISGDGGPDLESIGSMPIGLIDQSTGLATGQSINPFYANACPFGGAIAFSGHVINSSGGVGGTGLTYRILISQDGGSTYAPMTGTFNVETNNWLTSVQTTVPQSPDSSGWYQCRENYAATIDVVGNVLGYFDTAGNNRLWVAMEVMQGAVPLGPSSPVWTMIQLDNTAPAPVDVAITSGGGSCGDFTPGSKISGTYSASDNEALDSVTISVEMPMPGATLSQALSTATLTSQSGTWELDTLTTTDPCGYTITADAVDNTIVDSGGIGWHGYGYTGFCLRPAGS